MEEMENHLLPLFFFSHLPPQLPHPTEYLGLMANELFTASTFRAPDLPNYMLSSGGFLIDTFQCLIHIYIQRKQSHFIGAYNAPNDAGKTWR